LLFVIASPLAAAFWAELSDPRCPHDPDPAGTVSDEESHIEILAEKSVL